MSAGLRPLGVVTRGITNPNRLRRFDRWIVHRAGAALRRHPDGVVVDLGYGASPVTTLELADRLETAVGRPVRVVGLEIDPERLRARVLDEPSPTTGDLYPHIYGPINRDAVVAVHAFDSI